MVGVLLVVAFIARVAFGMAFCDLSSGNYFEYGEIVRNLHAGNGYSLFHKSGSVVDLWFSPSASPFPSAYMPPGYPIFLFPFFWIEDVQIRNVAIILVQSALAALSVAALYLFTRRTFGQATAVIAAGIAALLPEFLYASISFNTVVFQHLCLLLILFYLNRFPSLSAASAVILGTLVAMGIFFRSEFFLFGCVFLGLEALRGNRRGAILSTITVVLLLTPWTIRNAVQLENFVPLTTNGGFNLYRGHNPEGIGSWGEESVQQEVAALEPGNDFEVRMQRVYLGHAISHIEAEPLSAFANGFVKLFHLWLLNPNDERSEHPMYLYPWLFVLLLALVGFWKSRSWEKFRHVYLFLICSSAVAFVFFALPRYQTLMKIAVLPFTAHGIMLLYGSLKNPRE